MDTKITASSGNVFRDLGFDEAEAEHLRIRSSLIIAVLKLIEERSLTRIEAAKLFGVTQPRISNVVRGRIDLFSIDTLVDMLARAGVHVDLVFSTLRHPSSTWHELSRTRRGSDSPARNGGDAGCTSPR
jgi:predicted XRE-type DNA-binding protein